MGKQTTMEVMEINNKIRDFYKGKKVFVSGHTGFKGAWLLQILQIMGSEVMGYALSPETQPNLYESIEGDTLCTSIIDDIRNKESLQNAILDFQPDIVFHMAAQPLVLDGYERPAYTYEVNVMGTVYMLEAIRKLDKKLAFVNITTDKVYENIETLQPYKEEDRLGGYDPYSNSKACSELVTQSYRDSFFNKQQIEEHQKFIATARSGNVIGGGDWAENRIIPDVARALIANKTITVRNPDAIRPWQHVLDPLRAYLWLALNLYEGGEKFIGSYNFGPNPKDELTVRQLVEEAIKIWGTGSFDSPKKQNKPHEAGLLKLDIDKAHRVLNWQPQLDAAEGIRQTMEWYKNAANAKSITTEQINAFFEL